MEITINPVKKMIKNAGSGRVSEDAARELARIMEERAMLICKRAGELAKIAGRRTVMKSDIKLAAKNIEK